MNIIMSPPVTDGHTRVTVSGNMILNNEGVFNNNGNETRHTRIL